MKHLLLPACIISIFLIISCGSHEVPKTVVSNTGKFNFAYLRYDSAALEYRLDSITGGSDALAEVTVKVEDLKGNVVSAKKSGEDVVVVSVQAVMDAINKTMLRKILFSKNQP